MGNFGYVIFANYSWLNLAQLAIEHINEFSKYKIHLFTINCDAEFDYPCLIKSRVNLANENFRTICNVKIFSSFNNAFDFGLIMDGDMLPLPNIDELLEENIKFIDYKYPICAQHPHSPHKNSSNQSSLNFIKDEFKISATVNKYVYASYLFTKNSKDFLKDCYDMGTYFEQKGDFNVVDETILNVKLSQLGDYEDIGYNYLPNYFSFPDYLNKNFLSEHIKNYTDYKCAIKYHILHGCKDINVARQYSNLIKSSKGDFLKLYAERPLIK